MKEVYLIPGLGADRRVFDCLDLSGYACSYVSWIDPLNGESIAHYASRLSEQIKSVNPILVGVSFGGMIAIELARQIKTEKVILISTVRTHREIPAYLKFFGRLGIQKLLPISWWKRPGWLLYFFFGTTEAAEKKLLAEIVHDTDPRFMQWAIQEIVRWKNEAIPAQAVLIHGSDDRIFPHRKADIVIPEGGHFMIVSKAREISEVLRKIV